MLSTFLFFLTVFPVSCLYLNSQWSSFFVGQHTIYIIGVLCMITTLFPAIEIEKPKNNFRIPFLLENIQCITLRRAGM